MSQAGSSEPARPDDLATPSLEVIFLGARALLADPSRWERSGQYCRDGRYCLIGACGHAAGLPDSAINVHSPDFQWLRKRVIRVLRTQLPEGQNSLAQFNNRVAWHEDVLALLDRAAQATRYQTLAEGRQSDDTK